MLDKIELISEFKNIRERTVKMTLSEISEEINNKRKEFRKSHLVNF